MSHNTPETIELKNYIDKLVEKCERLERERDDAREENVRLRNIIEIAISIGKGEVGFPDWGFICEEFYKLKEETK